MIAIFIPIRLQMVLKTVSFNTVIFDNLKLIRADCTSLHPEMIYICYEWFLQFDTFESQRVSTEGFII